MFTLKYFLLQESTYNNQEWLIKGLWNVSLMIDQFSF